MASTRAVSSYPEYLDVEVSYDGGATFQTIASYEGNGSVMSFDASEVDAGGATSGPDITDAGTNLAFDLDPTQSTAIVRLSARASTDSENFQINSVGVQEGYVPVSVVSSEDFDNLTYVSQSSEVAYSSNFYVDSGAVTSYGGYTSYIVFEDVNASVYDSISASFDIASSDPGVFESNDYFRVWANIDGDWALLDTFTVNGAGDAFVGDTSGQSFSGTSATLDYDLSSANSSAYLYVESSTSYWNETFTIDNYAINAGSGTT